MGCDCIDPRSEKALYLRVASGKSQSLKRKSYLQARRGMQAVKVGEASIDILDGGNSSRRIILSSRLGATAGKRR